MGFLDVVRRPLRYRFYNATIGLIVVNVVLFLATLVAPRVNGYLALTPLLVIRAGAWWQLFTYQFAHASFLHLFFNMLGLFMFGVQLEHRMGSSEFMLYYLLTGLGAGIATLGVNWLTGQVMVSVLGASGAIFGVLLAFAAFFPDSVIYIFGILPLRAPTAVLIFAGIEVFSQFVGARNGVAHLTHLAGLLFGGLLLALRFRINPLQVFSRRR
jgi:membrane associated rhomboid family serine protease